MRFRCALSIQTMHIYIYCIKITSGNTHWHSFRVKSIYSTQLSLFICICIYSLIYDSFHYVLQWVILSHESVLWTESTTAQNAMKVLDTVTCLENMLCISVSYDVCSVDWLCRSVCWWRLWIIWEVQNSEDLSLSFTVEPQGTAKTVWYLLLDY